MSKLFSIVLLATLLTVSACKKEELKLTGSNYLMFGSFYGMCTGEQCIEVFRLEEGKLLEDTTDKYPERDNFYAGKFIQLSEQKYNDTKDLIDYFPKDLLNETTTVIGQPDATDGGGLYIEYNFNGTKKFWLIDQMKDNVPSKYHTFIVKVNDKIKNLK